MDSLVLDALIAGGGAGVSGLLYLASRMIRKPTTTPVPAEAKLIGHIDEYLWNDRGFWVPFQPPKFVTPGTNPTAAARSLAIENNQRIHTRRVELP